MNSILRAMFLRIVPMMQFLSHRKQKCLRMQMLVWIKRNLKYLIQIQVWSTDFMERVSMGFSDLECICIFHSWKALFDYNYAYGFYKLHVLCISWKTYDIPIRYLQPSSKFVNNVHYFWQWTLFWTNWTFTGKFWAFK